MLVGAVVRHVRRAALVGVVLALAVAGLPSSAQAVSTGVVISQVYGGGGNSGATHTHDFIELFNRGTSTASVGGWSVQYASAGGTGNFGENNAQITELPDVALAPGQYLLVQEASNAAVGAPLPTPDGCNGGSTLCPPAALAQIVDLVGYGNANFFEGPAAAPTASNTTSVQRGAAGCADTDDNRADFTAAAPDPRNSAADPNPCPSNDPVVAACGGPLSTIEGVAASTRVTAADADGTVIDVAITQVTPSPAPG